MPRPTPSRFARLSSGRHARRCLVLVAVAGLGGCAAISKNCPTDPRADAPWWCAVANVEGDVYERETDRRGGEVAGERGELDEAEAAVGADRERLAGAESGNAALAAELDRLRSEVRSAERKLEEQRASSARSGTELRELESRLGAVTAEIEALGSGSTAEGGADVAAARARRAELEAELDSILETLAE